MGGKTLKFPRRKKYVAPIPKAPKQGEEPISEEEHKARLEKLKALGLIK